eukprot:CAMPEP_0185567292 /NCGR_PEP_ID=MMETSP0434-20130131/613_1 /TAXON_ID=626734 ORGANISM="Favella taraikaensis, Strain Fe Narragansett Bay" /NCGR_SAMPLE_ID=MMETSP0434 /ASSEMBLY_ACC=CAM_ASM_000379 /LENGTH=105 /DNA_ID=CAMNT_0028181497 /DNA_START=1043 /DNA_END=1360 /DNA_ORIENTATION=+
MEMDDVQPVQEGGSEDHQHDNEDDHDGSLTHITIQIDVRAGVLVKFARDNHVELHERVDLAAVIDLTEAIDYDSANAVADARQDGHLPQLVRPRREVRLVPHLER